MRKTVTSCEVKDRWNRAHYDQVMFRVGAGGKDVVRHLAEESGLSVAAYIKHLIIKDAQERGNGDISAIIGGGGNLIGYEGYKQLLEACELRQLPIVPFTAGGD